MSKYRLTIGDWSSDGHEKTKVFVIEIPNQFTGEVMQANFKKNINRIGFDPTKLAKDYEDSSISEDQIEALERTGFDFEQGVGLFSDYPISREERQINGPEGMVAILMHFIGYGFEYFQYKIINESLPQLFGYWESGVISSDSVGYGLFY